MGEGRGETEGKGRGGGGGGVVGGWEEVCVRGVWCVGRREREEEEGLGEVVVVAERTPGRIRNTPDSGQY